MRIVKQKFFDEFACAADKCQDTCCKGWEICIDDDTASFYRGYKGKLKEIIDNSVDFDESIIKYNEDGRCCLLRDDGLCTLVREIGEEALCDTCHMYPRHVEEYEDVREWSLAISCPVAAHMILTSEDNEYIITENDNEDPLEDDFEDFDFILFDNLLSSRDVMFSILGNKKLKISERAGLVLEFSKRLQEFYDSGDYFFMEDAIEDFSSEEFLLQNASEYELVFSKMVNDNFEILEELEQLGDDWDDILALIESYPDNAVHEDFIEGVSKERHLKMLENLFNALLFTYYLGSIYNGMIYGYTKMSLFGVIIIDALALSKSKKLKRKITIGEYEEILYKYSRETEHSDDNIGTLLEYFDL